MTHVDYSNLKMEIEKITSIQTDCVEKLELILEYMKVLSEYAKIMMEPKQIFVDPTFGHDLADPVDDQERGLTQEEVDANRIQGIQDTERLSRLQMSNAIGLIPQSGSEQDFETSRQSAIDATNTYYDAVLAGINASEDAEDVLEAKRKANAIAREDDLKRLRDLENTYTAERIEGEEAAAQAREEAMQAALEAEAAALEELNRVKQESLELDVKAADNQLDSAKYALQRSANEAEFETNRQAAIAVTNEYYDAEEARINALMVSERERQILLDALSLSRTKDIESLTDTENKFTTLRIKAEEDAAEAAVKAAEEKSAAAEKAEQERMLLWKRQQLQSKKSH